jgi:hypothetical protein
MSVIPIRCVSTACWLGRGRFIRADCARTAAGAENSNNAKTTVRLCIKLLLQRDFAKGFEILDTTTTGNHTPKGANPTSLVDLDAT